MLCPIKPHSAPLLPGSVYYIRELQAAHLVGPLGRACCLPPGEHSPGQNTGVGSLSLLLGIFPTQPEETLVGVREQPQLGVRGGRGSFMEVLTRNRADAELNQAGEREGARVAEKASNSHRLPSGPRQTAVGQGGDLVSSGNSFPPRQPGDAAEPHVLRSGSWGLEQEMRTPLGPQQVGVGRVSPATTTA